LSTPRWAEGTEWFVVIEKDCDPLRKYLESIGAFQVMGRVWAVPDQPGPASVKVSLDELMQNLWRLCQHEDDKVLVFPGDSEWHLTDGRGRRARAGRGAREP
jgi:hypothetical protein